MADSTLPDSLAPTPDPGDGSIFGPIHLTRAMILVVAILCAIVFYYAARWLPWPTEPGFRGSLAQPKAALGGFLVAIALLIVCTFVATLLVARRWYLAGLMAATAGLSTWSVRGGTMTGVLFNAANSGANQAVFLQMIGELIVFFGVIAALWNLIWNLTGREAINAASTPEARAAQAAKMREGTRHIPFVRIFVFASQATAGDASTGASEEGRSTPAALLAQTAVMFIVMLILAVTPMKKQVLTSIFLAGLASTAVAEGFFADRKAGRWYWIAPLLVGVFGYAAGYFSPAGLETGDLQGFMAPLTRALPLDYASMGCAGVLFGYWWMEPEATAADPARAEVDDGPAKRSGSATRGDSPISDAEVA